MGKVKDLTGQKFGRLTVVEHIGFTEPNKHGSRYAIWKCKCDCGNYINRSVDVIKRGKSSCGCDCSKCSACCKNKDKENNTNK